MRLIVLHTVPWLLAALVGTASAGTYYVKSDGNDDADGTSDATAWRTLTKVNGFSFGPGDDVLLKSGSVFDRQYLTIDWAGTTTDKVVLGCYYLDGSNNNQATLCNEGSRNGFTDLPAIKGALTDACIAANNCDYGTGYVAGGIWQGLINVTTDHVRVQDVSVSYSKGSGIRAGSVNDVRIARVLVEKTGIVPVAMGNGVQNVVFRDSTVRNYNLCEVQEHNGGPTPGIANCGTGGWPGGVLVVRSPDAQALIENNDIHIGFGEGINCLQSSHVIVRGNRVGNVHSGGIYFDGCSSSVAEHNILWGTQGDPSPSNWGGGMNFNIEDTACCNHQLNHNVVRNNLFVDTGGCINAAMGADAEAAGLLLGARIYANTCVSIVNFDLRINAVPDANVAEWTAKNNIFFTTDGVAVGGNPPPCQLNSNTEVDYNLWAVANPDPDCEGAHDAPDGDPLLAQSVYSAWDAMDYANPPRVDDFRLQPGSAAIGAGDPALVTTTVLSSADFPLVFSDMSHPFTPEAAAWEKALYYDFEGSSRDPQAPDLGALEYADPIVEEDGGGGDAGVAEDGDSTEPAEPADADASDSGTGEDAAIPDDSPGDDAGQEREETAIEASGCACSGQTPSPVCVLLILGMAIVLGRVVIPRSRRF